MAKVETTILVQQTTRSSVELGSEAIRDVLRAWAHAKWPEAFTKPGDIQVEFSCARYGEFEGATLSIAETTTDKRRA